MHGRAPLVPFSVRLPCTHIQRSHWIFGLLDGGNFTVTVTVSPQILFLFLCKKKQQLVHKWTVYLFPCNSSVVTSRSLSQDDIVWTRQQLVCTTKGLLWTRELNSLPVVAPLIPPQRHSLDRVGVGFVPFRWTNRRRQKLNQNTSGMRAIIRCPSRSSSAARHSQVFVSLSYPRFPALWQVHIR